MDAIYEILQKKFMEARARSPGFSQRAFARRLGVSSGALSEILKRKRKISLKVAHKFSERLQFSPLEKKKIGLPIQKESRSHQLDEDTFHLIADWWYLGILNLCNTNNFRSDPKWIADRLGISALLVKQSIERLLRLKLLQRDAKGNFTRLHGQLQSSDEVKSLAVRKCHSMNLQLAEKALHEVELNLRDFFAITCTLNLEKLQELKAQIRKFMDEFMEEAESTPGDEVYRLSLQLIPVTKVKKERVK